MGIPEYPKVELNPELVARVQMMSDAGLTLRVISGILEKEGIMNAQGMPYSPSSIKSMVDSPMTPEVREATARLMEQAGVAPEIVAALRR
jgi:hypothetical protein